MNTTIENLTTLIHDLLGERDYQRHAGASELEQMELAIGQLQLSRAVMVAYRRHGLA